MKVFFDNIIFYLQRSGGGTTYWLEIITRAKSDPFLEVTFSEPRAKSENKPRLNADFEINLIEKLPVIFLRILNFTNSIKEKAIFHSSYYRISKAPCAINVITIHDFIPEYFFGGIRKRVHLFRKSRAIKNADGIICISENTQKDLLKFYPQIDRSKIRVIYNGVSDDYFLIKKENIDVNNYHEILTQKYVIYVGHRTSYKNFNIVAEAIAKLDHSFLLLIIGEQLSEVEKQFLDQLILGRYVCLSGIDNQTLNIYYNFSHSLIYPSSYEGFGIPVLEAMKAGCPVVTTNLSSIPEVAGNAAVVVGKILANDFAHAINMLSEENMRSKIIKAGFKQAEKFSWDKCYLEVKEFYKTLYHFNK